MPKRNFELFCLHLHRDLSVLGALKETAAGEACIFSCAQAQMLERVKKKNTALFDQLAEELRLPYETGENTLDTFLYDVIIVDMLDRRFDGDLCIPGADGRTAKILPGEKLAEWIYARGFTITGVPKRGADGCREGEETEDIHYRAFVASASMARKGQYLFVNDEVYDGLMERISLGFVTCGADHALSMAAIDGKTTVFASKLSAYLGLSLSDGSSVREMQTAWRQMKGTQPPEIPLNAETVAVVPDYTVKDDEARRLFGEKGPFVWTTEEVPPAMRRPEEYLPLAEARQADEDMQLLCAFFRAFAGGREELRAFAQDREEMIVRAWRNVAEKLLAEGNIPECAENLLPVPEKCAAEGVDPLLSCVEVYAWHWLTALTLRCMRAPGSLKTDDLRAATANTLEMLAQETVDSRCPAWNTLFNLLKDANSCVYACVSAAAGDEAAEGWKIFALANGEKSLRYACYCGENPAATYGARLTPVDALEDFSINHFDGIGFCDPEYFDRLERLLLMRDEPMSPRRFDAVIIRLPWFKGVLVRMDFKTYFAAQGGKGETVTDMFGVKRDLSKLHVLATKSMFKGYAYLTALCDAKETDPWREYWRRVEKYGASLLIAGRNSTPSARSRLNYQFLSTIGFTDNEIQALAADAVAEMHGLLTDSDAQREYFLKNLRAAEEAEADASEADELGAETLGNDGEGEISDDGDGDEESTSAGTDELFARALAVCPELIESGYAKRAVQGKARNVMIDSMMGRLPVEGDVRVLAPDLKMMLDYIWLRRVLGDEDAPITSAINDGAPGHGCYYAPGANAPWKKDGGKTVVALRNPHFAVGEDALLEPLPADVRAEYDKFFGHLTGVAMLPASAFSTINGADVDGDRANICCDDRVIAAVRRTAKENLALLEDVLGKKAEIADWIGEKIAAIRAIPPQKRDRTKTRELEYWRSLLEWTRLAIPEMPETHAWAADYCPALVFGASAGGRGGFRVREAEKKGLLEAKIWRAFDLTTRQRIGIMSIQALELASVAYAKTAQAEEDLCSLLRRWLWHWRVVTCGLDAANEIDMAKTGLMLSEHVLRSPIEAGQKFSLDLRKIEQRRASALREMRTQREKAAADLALSWRFASKMNEIRKTLQHVRPKAEEEHHPLDLLPYGVFDGLAEKLAPAPRGGNLPRLKFPEGNGRSLFEIARERLGEENISGAVDVSAPINAYNAYTRRRKRADGRRQAQFDRYGYCMRNLQKRYSLAEAFRHMRACVGDGTVAGSFLRDADITGGMQLAHLYNSLEKDEVLARLVWAQTQEERVARIGELLCSVPGARTPQHLPEAIVRDEQGVYLFKEIVKYLKEAEAVALMPAADGVNTPEGLREKLSGIAGGRGTLGRSLLGQGAMNDFLFLQLCGDEFAEMMKPEEKQHVRL